MSCAQDNSDHTDQQQTFHQEDQWYHKLGRSGIGLVTGITSGYASTTVPHELLEFGNFGDEHWIASLILAYTMPTIISSIGELCVSRPDAYFESFRQLGHTGAVIAEYMQQPSKQFKLANERVKQQAQIDHNRGLKNETALLILTSPAVKRGTTSVAAWMAGMKAQGKEIQN